jgi:hypothetical protein
VAVNSGDGADFHNSGGDTSTEYTHTDAGDAVHNATIMASPVSMESVDLPQVLGLFLKQTACQFFFPDSEAEHIGQLPFTEDR